MSNRRRVGKDRDLARRTAQAILLADFLASKAGTWTIRDEAALAVRERLRKVKT